MTNNLQDPVSRRRVVNLHTPFFSPITVALVDGRTVPPSRSFHPRAAPPSAEEPKIGHRAVTWPARPHSAKHRIGFHGDSSLIRHLQGSPPLRISPRSRLARGYHRVSGYPNHLSQRPRPPHRPWVGVAEWSTFGTRSLEAIEPEVAVGWHLAPPETSQAAVCSHFHNTRCGAPGLFVVSSLTITHSRLGNL